MNNSNNFEYDGSIPYTTDELIAAGATVDNSQAHCTNKEKEDNFSSLTGVGASNPTVYDEDYYANLEANGYYREGGENRIYHADTGFYVAKPEKNPPNKSPLEFFNGDDLADNAPAPDFLINDILETDSHGILVAMSQAFKTFLALMIAHCLCTGNSFMGYEVFTTGKVLYICGEGKGALSRRIKALKIVLGGFNNNLMVLHSRIGIDDSDDMLLRLKPLLEEHQPLFVIFDTYSSLATDTDENSNTDVAKVLKLIRETCTNGITSSMIVHHNGKDAGKGARGASAFRNNTDFELSMKRKDDSMSTILHCEKMKDGDLFPDIHMTAHVVELGLIRQDGKETTSLVLKQSDESEKPKATTKAKELTPKQQNILSEITRVINQHGFLPNSQLVKERFPDSSHNAPKKVLDDTTLRHWVYKTITTKNPTKSFDDYLASLLAAEEVCFYDGFYWINPYKN